MRAFLILLISLLFILPAQSDDGHKNRHRNRQGHHQVERNRHRDVDFRQRNVYRQRNVQRNVYYGRGDRRIRHYQRGYYPFYGAPFYGPGFRQYGPYGQPTIIIRIP
jgi:hypothetical protein